MRRAHTPIEQFQQDRAAMKAGNFTGITDFPNQDVAMWVSMALYLPLSMLFWHAPALVYWQQIEPLKSLFFSFMACWQNKGAMLVYLLAWMGVDRKSVV